MKKFGRVLLVILSLALIVLGIVFVWKSSQWGLRYSDLNYSTNLCADLVSIEEYTFMNSLSFKLIGLIISLFGIKMFNISK
jgi:hypothetical protein